MLIVASVTTIQTGPIRLFVPYKRRKKDLEPEPVLSPSKKARLPSTVSVKSPIASQMGLAVPKIEVDQSKFMFVFFRGAHA